jgi:predicted RND superfamily exporter protein
MTKENTLTSYVSHKMGYSLSNLNKIEETNKGNNEVLLIKCNEKSSEPNFAQSSLELRSEIEEVAEKVTQTVSTKATSNLNLATNINPGDQLQQQSSSKVMNQLKKNSNRFISKYS